MNMTPEEMVLLSKRDQEMIESPIPSDGSDGVISDRDTYLEEMEEKTPNAKLDRSEFFRYPKDSDIIKSLIREAFLRGEKCNSLIIGVGNMEEPLSLLALAQQVAIEDGRKLEELVDLEMVEIRTIDEVSIRCGLGKIYGNAFGKAFITEETKDQYSESPRKPDTKYANVFEYNDQSKEYEFAQGIIDFLKSILADPSKAYFGTPVEDFVTGDDQKYDLVSCNNVLQHMGGISQYKSPFRDKNLVVSQYSDYLNSVSGILEKVKSGGTLIAHTEGSIKGDDPFGKHASRQVFDMIEGFEHQFSLIQDSVYKRK